MKVAYVGIDILYPVLENLYACGCEIIKVFTCRTDNVTEFNTKTVGFAREHGIPVKMDRMTADDLREMAALGCRFVMVGGYYYRIPVIDDIPIVNTHPALLPKGRGAWPMPVTILKGLGESGVTLHRMVEAMDEGDIILQKSVPVYPEDDLVTLTERLWSVIPALVGELVGDFDNLWYGAYPQGDDAEYWDMPTEENYTVRSDMSFEEADLILRAFMGYECIYKDSTKGVKLEFIEAVAHRGTPDDREVPAYWPIRDGYITCERIRNLTDD